MNGRHVAMALPAALLMLFGSDIVAIENRAGHPYGGGPMPAAPAHPAHFSQPVSWDVSISSGKRGDHRHDRHDHGHFKRYRHGHRHYGYSISPYKYYREQGHPDYGYRSHGYRSNSYDSDGSYLYRGGRYRHWYPEGRGYGYGQGYRHRR